MRRRVSWAWASMQQALFRARRCSVASALSHLEATALDVDAERQPLRVAVAQYAVMEEDRLASYLVQPRAEAFAVKEAVEWDHVGGHGAVEDSGERRLAVQPLDHEVRNVARVSKAKILRVLRS